MSSQSLYDLLGVLESASDEEIKTAYRRKMTHLHPDRGGSEEAAKQLNAAHETLSDPASRTLYDRSRQSQAMTCFICDSPVSSHDELMAHVMRHRAEVEAAQQIVRRESKRAETRKQPAKLADEPWHREREVQRAEGRRNGSTSGESAASGPWIRAFAVVFGLGIAAFVVVAVFVGGGRTGEVSAVDDALDGIDVLAASDEESRAQQVPTTNGGSPTTNLPESTAVATSVPLAAANTTPVAVRASAAELLFGHPTLAWTDEGGMVSDALSAASLGWSGPDDWGIVADGVLTDLWVWGGGCVDRLCERNITFSTAGFDSSRHVWWLFLGSGGMNASDALGFELRGRETHSHACWSAVYNAPVVFTSAGSGSGTADRAWVYADEGDGPTWYIADPSVLEINPSWAESAEYYVSTTRDAFC